MPVDDVRIAGNTDTGDTRPGFDSAVDRFCEAAAGEKLDAGDTFLSYATQVEHDGGNDPTVYGQLAFVECMFPQHRLLAGCDGRNFADPVPVVEIHNRQDVEHEVDGEFAQMIMFLLLSVRLTHTQRRIARAISRSSRRRAVSATVLTTKTPEGALGRLSTASSRIMPNRAARRRRITTSTRS